MMARDGELRTRYAVAHELSKTLDEIDAMTALEFHGWVEFIKLKRGNK